MNLVLEIINNEKLMLILKYKLSSRLVLMEHSSVFIRYNQTYSFIRIELFKKAETIISN
jgi:hypothetical protein